MSCFRNVRTLHERPAKQENRLATQRNQRKPKTAARIVGFGLLERFRRRRGVRLAREARSARVRLIDVPRQRAEYPAGRRRTPCPAWWTRPRG